MRSVDCSIRKERARRDESCGHPSVREVTSKASQCEAEERKDCQDAGFRSDEEVAQGRLRQLSLDHQEKACSPGFDRLVAAEHETELMLLRQGAENIPSSCCRIHRESQLLASFDAVNGAVPKFTLNRAHQIVTA
jgi:hypothetical protein